jgi:hypothetical protein
LLALAEEGFDARDVLAVLANAMRLLKLPELLLQAHVEIVHLQLLALRMEIVIAEVEKSLAFMASVGKGGKGLGCGGGVVAAESGCGPAAWWRPGGGFL